MKLCDLLERRISRRTQVRDAFLIRRGKKSNRDGDDLPQPDSGARPITNDEYQPLNTVAVPEY